MLKALLPVANLQQKSSIKITQLGSNWNNGTNAGSFYWNLNNSVRNRNRNISSHLINALMVKAGTSKKVVPALICGSCLTMPLGKTEKT